MDLLRISFALGLPWLLGALVVHRIVPVAMAGRRALLLGYGFLVGVMLLTLLMRGLDAAGFGLHLIVLVPVVLLLIAIGALLEYRYPRPFGGVWLSQDYRDLPVWQKLLIAVLLTILAIRFGGLWLEVHWRPLFPWDAYMHWATKSRVWTDAQAIVPFVDYDEWLALQGRGVFTDNHPGYPITTPLLQTWMNLMLGRWDDALMNLPWVLVAAAGGMAFFGQARMAGIGPLAALVFCYFLLSMPILNLQVALAGYADVFMGIFYLAALMAFYHWSNTRFFWQGLLALLLAAGCFLIKNEALFWILALLPGLAAVFFPLRRLILLVGLGILFGVGVLLFFPPDLEVAGHTLAGLGLQFHSDAVIPLLQSLFWFSNWHLLFWMVGFMLLARVIIGFLSGTRWPRPLLALSLILGSAFVLFLVLFLYTGYAVTVVGQTSVGRIALQLAPSFVFFAMLLYQDLAKIPAIAFPLRSRGSRLD